jgi:hypothetical protein
LYSDKHISPRPTGASFSTARPAVNHRYCEGQVRRPSLQESPRPARRTNETRRPGRSTGVACYNSWFLVFLKRRSISASLRGSSVLFGLICASSLSSPLSTPSCVMALPITFVTTAFWHAVGASGSTGNRPKGLNLLLDRATTKTLIAKNTWDYQRRHFTKIFCYSFREYLPLAHLFAHLYKRFLQSLFRLQ